jgi:small subunit ribosomal protein S13
MARLVGVDLPRDKRVEVALTYIFGVGRTTSSRRWQRRVLTRRSA